MIYCLMTEDHKIRVEIKCALANKPATVNDLIVSIHKGLVELTKPQRVPTRLRELAEPDEPLITDWERTGAQARYIDWIPTENL